MIRACSIALVLVFVPVAHAQDSWQFRWQKGQTLNYKIKHVTSVTEVIENTKNSSQSTLDLVNRTFQLRTCEIEIDGKLPRPCLEYHLKRCLGPCVKGLCTPEEYREAARDVRMLLEGKDKQEDYINRYGAIFGRKFKKMFNAGDWAKPLALDDRTDYMLPNPALQNTSGVEKH